MSEQTTENSVPVAEIKPGASPFAKFLDNYQEKLIIVGILIIVGMGVYLITSQLKSSYHAEAGAAFAAAHDMPALREVVAEFDDTPAAGSALLKLSQMQWLNAEQQESIATLQQLLETYPKHPLATSATAALASHQLELGEVDQAKENFKKVVAAEDHLALAPLALLSLGDIARREGNEEEARKYYEKIQSEKYSQIAYSTISAANERLALLGVAPPAKENPKPSGEINAEDDEISLPHETPEEDPVIEATPEAENASDSTSTTYEESPSTPAGKSSENPEVADDPAKTQDQ